MKEEILILKVYQELDEDDFILLQEIFDKEHDLHFSVCNLSDCPEDAIIERELFNADDYIKALNVGISLAEHGIKKVVKVIEG